MRGKHLRAGGWNRALGGNKIGIGEEKEKKRTLSTFSLQFYHLQLMFIFTKLYIRTLHSPPPSPPFQLHMTARLLFDHRCFSHLSDRVLEGIGLLILCLLDLGAASEHFGTVE